MPKINDVSAQLKSFDDEIRKEHHLIAGVDEAGRGPLAGPVVAACAMFSPDTLIPYVNDSKKLSPKRRREVFTQIIAESFCYSTGIVPNETIDSINILNATKEAMSKAIKKLDKKPDILLIDALELSDVDMEQMPLIKGDAKSFSIAAASIIAKTVRDDIMEEYDKMYPGYGFAKHKGYGTKDHYEAIRKLGPCPIHRMTFLKKLH